VRIDHFRGFESYYAIPYGDKDAKNGVWEKGRAQGCSRRCKKNTGSLNIIAEDLGFLDDGVREMVKDTGFPGMKILQFAFGGDEKNEYLPQKPYK
jgi:4-alpha-glucanotransferase